MGSRVAPWVVGDNPVAFCKHAIGDPLFGSPTLTTSKRLSRVPHDRPKRAASRSSVRRFIYRGVRQLGRTSVIAGSGNGVIKAKPTRQG